MGRLYGIGVGPGDPELLTLKAYRILNKADVIFCPEKEAGAGSVAFDIIRGLLEHDRAKVVRLVYPMHYRGEKLEEIWAANARQIAELLEGDRTGAFVTLGDPAVYSTFMYSLPYIEQAGVPVEVVPGITSFCAVADAAKIPLMTWNEELLVAPVRKNDSGQLGKLLAEHDNVVLMKPSANKAELLAALRAQHLEHNFVLVARAGMEDEQIIEDLEELEQSEIPYLSTMIIKKARL